VRPGSSTNGASIFPSKNHAWRPMAITA
jgi:hypothetical protein